MDSIRPIPPTTVIYLGVLLPYQPARHARHVSGRACARPDRVLGVPGHAYQVLKFHWPARAVLVCLRLFIGLPNQFPMLFY